MNMRPPFRNAVTSRDALGTSNTTLTNMVQTELLDVDLKLTAGHDGMPLEPPAKPT